MDLEYLKKNAWQKFTYNFVNFFKRFNVLPKMFCVLVAFLIWLYVTAVESPDHEETITSVPVELFGVGTLESEHNLSPVSGREIKQC